MTTTAADQRLTRRTTGITGLAAAVVFAIGSALWALDQPSGGASGQEIVAFYTDGSTRIVVGASLSLVAIALFAFFASGVRAILREREAGELFATAAFAGGLTIVATGLGAETINMAGALRADDGTLSPELGRALFEISYVLGYNAAGVGIGILLLATAGAGLQASRLLPRPVAIALVVAGIAFLTPLSRYLMAPAVLLIAVLSVQLLRTPPPD